MSDHAANPDLRGWVEASEIDNIDLLKGEINKLRDENIILKEKLAVLEKASDQSRANLSDSFKETYNVLKSIDIKIPEELNKACDENASGSLLDLLWLNKDTLINGVTNSIDANAAANFLYYNIYPKLHIHGLSDNEKVTGVRYRRSFINKNGLEFLSKLEKMRLDQNKKDLINNTVRDDSAQKDSGSSKIKD
jgi:hypothetical protein